MAACDGKLGIRGARCREYATPAFGKRVSCFLPFSVFRKGRREMYKTIPGRISRSPSGETPPFFHAQIQERDKGEQQQQQQQ